MEALFQDLRYALRMIRKSPGTTAIALLTIGVATGANATVFGFVSALLLRPTPGVANPSTLVAIYTSDFSSGPYGSSSYPDYVSIKSETRAFSAVAAEGDGAAAVVKVGNNVERVSTTSVTGDYFSLLGLTPFLGRTLTTADVAPSAPAVVVISHRFWQRALAADPSVLGSDLVADGKLYRIVGVLPEGFGGLDLGHPVQVWTALTPPSEEPGARGNRSLAIIARLAPRTSVAEAQTQVSTLAARLSSAFPETNRGTLASPNAPRPMFVLPHSHLPPEFKPMVTAVSAILIAAVALVLVIACANVAGLLVARAIARDREMAVRLALGAARIRLVRQLLTESVLLGVGGGICGLLLALWTSDILPSFFPAEQAQLLDTSVNLRTVWFIAAISIASSLLCGLAPALHTSGEAAPLALRTGTTRGSDGRRALRLRWFLVAAQVATAVVLLVSSGLLVKSLTNALTADLGFATHEGVIATVEPTMLDATRGQQYYDDVLERVRALPGVHDAAFVRTLPLSRGARRRFRIEGYTSKPGEDMELPVNFASEGYFEAMQIPLRQGRTFTTADKGGTPPIVIVNDMLAGRFYAGDAVGKRLTDSTGRTFEIVGVVQSHKYLTVQEPPVATVFYPLRQNYVPGMTLAARVDGPAAGLVDPIARTVAAVNPNVPVYRSMLLSTHFDESTATDRLTTSLVALCGGMALLLATIGVYGVIAYAVVRRSPEIGIRVALGARPYDVGRLILVEGLSVTGAGIVLGLAAAALSAQVMRSFLPLYGVGPRDPATYAAVPAALLIVAFLAALPPMRRALRLDPNIVLRDH